MNALTADIIAARVGCSVRVVRKRLAGAEDFFAGYAPRREGAAGPPVKLYDPAVLPALWGSRFGVNIAEQPSVTVRKVRNDRGKARGKSQALVDYATRLAFTEYLAAAIPDVRGACRRAIAKLMQQARVGALAVSGDQVAEVEKLAKAEWLYKKWIYSNTKSFTGPYYSQLWKAAWESEHKRYKQAMDYATVRYTTWDVLESGFGCSRGSGFARFIMLDDRLSDARTGENKKQHYAIYAWCVLTGALLWVEPCETVTAQSYIRTVLSVIAAHGLQERMVWFMENAKAAIATRVQGVIKSLYTEEELANPGEAHKMLFHSNSYVVRNVPSIPRGFGKGFGERSFLRLKTGYDALHYPGAFQGGNRNETVQLTRSSTPVFRNVPEPEDYFRRLLGFAYTEYVDTPRASLNDWAAVHNAQPTIRSMVDYYRSNEKRVPTPEQVAYLLYWAQPELTVVRRKNPGVINCQINGRFYNLRHSALYDPHLTNKKIAVVPLPDNPDFCALYLYDSENPRFICAAEDYRARTVEDASRMQKDSRRMREEFATRVENSKQAVRLATVEEVVSERVSQLDAVAQPAQELPAWASVKDGDDDCKIIDAEVYSDDDDDDVLGDIQQLDF